MLSESLKGVVSQMLLKKIGGGRLAAQEILIVNSAVSNLIREQKNYQIPSMMQTGKKFGMQLLDDVMLNLVKDKKVTPLEVYKKCLDKASMITNYERLGIEFDINKPEE